jgi:hypothetical protein
LETQAFTFASSPFVPVAVGLLGLGTGYFIWGGPVRISRGQRRVIDELPTIRELSDENGVLSGLVTQGESVSLLGEQYLSPFR